MAFIATILVSAIKLVGVCVSKDKHSIMINKLNLRPKRLTSNFAKRAGGIFFTLVEWVFWIGVSPLNFKQNSLYFYIKVNLSFYARFFTVPGLVTSLLIT